MTAIESGEIAMNRIGLALIGLLLCRELPDARQPALSTPAVAPAEIVRFPSAALGSEQVATVLLPSTYAETRTRYPVLYLLHGGGQDHTAFATRPWFQAQRSRNMIIVTPQAGDTWYVNSVADPNAKYEDLLVKDLLEYIDAHYRTIASPEGRAVAGISMGAWGAMLSGLKHHRLFGAVGALSAPFGISRQAPDMDMTSRTQQRFGAPGTPERRERDPGTLAAEISTESLPYLYLACGSQDLFVRDNRAFVQRLAERKLPYEYHEISPFGHSWDLWDPQLVDFIDVLSRRWANAVR
jgi:S-formylglutathione hydrolase FrmB